MISSEKFLNVSATSKLMFKNLRMFLNYSVILFFLSHFRNTNQTGGEQTQDFTVALYHSKQTFKCSFIFLK